MKRILALSLILLLASCCSYAAEQIRILGEVSKPGAYTLEPGMTNSQVLSLAGGLTNRADSMEVRRRDGQTIKVAAGELTSPAFLSRKSDAGPGDTVYVVPKLTNFTIVGEVKRPGVYPAEPGMTNSRVLSLAGGLTPRALRMLVSKQDGRAIDVTAKELANPAFLSSKSDIGPGDTIVVLPQVSINREFKDVPFPIALESVLKDGNRDYSYSMDPQLRDLTVTAILKNVEPFLALQILMNAAGATYTLDEDAHGAKTMQIKPKLVSSHTNASAAAPTVDCATEVESVTEFYHLNNVEAGDILSILKRLPHIASIDTVGTRRLLIRGTEDAIQSASRLIRALDVLEVYSKPIRTKVELVVCGPGNKRYSVATEILGPESVCQSSSSTLTIPLSTSEKGKMVLSLSLTPEIVGQFVPRPISVVGRGKISGRLPVGEFSQDFDFAVSVVDSSKPVTVTSAKMLDTTSVTVRISARIEEGHIKVVSEAARKMMEDSSISNVAAPPRPAQSPAATPSARKPARPPGYPPAPR